MDLTIAVSNGSSNQMILFAVQLLVFSAPLLCVKMNLLFTPVEVMAIVLTIVAIRNLTSDGSFTWIEGLMLLVV